jgi:hypothetical protein
MGDSFIVFLRLAWEGTDTKKPAFAGRLWCRFLCASYTFNQPSWAW